MTDISQLLRQAAVLHQGARWAQAEPLYQQILSVAPNQLDAIQRFSVLLLQTNRHAEAEQLMRRGLQFYPNSTELLNALGVLLTSQNRGGEAIPLFRRAIEIKPSADHHCALADALRSAGMWDEARAQYQRAISLRPDFLDAMNRLGSLLIDMKRFAEAVVIYRQCIAAAPGSPMHRPPGVAVKLSESWHRLGNALQGELKFDDAVQAYRQSLKLKADTPEVHYGLGNALLNIDHLEEALRSFREAMRLGLDLADLHWDYSLALLKSGDFLAAWPEYEYRDRKRVPNIPRESGKPRWRGEPLEGRRIFLQGEQAFGDRIQFIRYATMVAQLGGRVVVDALPELKRLFQGVVGVDEVFTPEEAVPEVDLCCPVLSLPMVFQTSLTTVPASVPYLFPEPELVQHWKDRIPPRESRRRIGLVWAGRPLPDPARTIGLEPLRPLLESDRFQFISLQTGPEAQQLQGSSFQNRILDYTGDLTDFAQTAALMDQLDLIITIDTAAAHLAGALGLPVWVLLKHHADYRWLLSRSDCPWYPTMKLFRQNRPGDWNSVIRAVCNEIAIGFKE